MQHEGVGVEAKLGDNERHSVRHEAGDEGHIAREAVELGDNYRALCLARASKSRRQLGPAVERIGALSRLDLDMLANDLDPLGLREPLDGRMPSRSASAID